jgi:hypothetical protein
MEMETKAAQSEMQQKMELMKMQAAIENERRDREAGRKDTEMNMKVMEMEKKLRKARREQKGKILSRRWS